MCYTFRVNAPVRIDALATGSPNRFRLRVADYLMLHEHGSFGDLETELVDGEVIVMGPEWRPHLRVKSELAFRLRDSLAQLGSDLFVGIDGSVAVSEHDVPQPDIILTDGIKGDGPVPIGSAALLVEISSSTLDQDFGAKAAIYARAGLPE